MRSFLRAIGLITLATIGSAAVLIGLIYATQMLTTIDKTPADFLPAEETVALFQSPNEEMLRRFAAWFPVLNDTHPLTARDTIALLQMGDGNIEVMRFRHKKDTLMQSTTPEGAERMEGAFIITASSPEVDSLITTQSLRLADEGAYRAFTKREPRETWTYIKLDAIPPPADMGNQLLSAFLLRNKTHAAFSPAENGYTVELLNAHKRQAYSIAPSIPHPPDKVLLTISAASPRESWEEAMNATDSETRQILQGSLEHFVTTRFGPDVSLTYGVLPLLEHPAILHVFQDAHFLIHGTAESSHMLTTHLSALHDSFEKTLPTTRIVERELEEDKFHSKDIRKDETLIVEGEELNNGWQVHETRHAEQDIGLFSARRGREYILSDSAIALENAIAGENGELITLPRGPTLVHTTLHAGGRVNLSEAFPQLTSILPPLEETTTSPLLPSLTGSLLWSVAQRGEITAVNVVVENF